MQSLLTNYREGLKSLVSRWPLAQSVEIKRDEIAEVARQGYLRLRVRMTNGDLFAMAQFYAIRGERVVVEDYRFHWQDAAGQLIKRWDNTPDHPGVPDFPDHLHDGDEKIVVPNPADGDLAQVLAFIEQRVREIEHLEQQE